MNWLSRQEELAGLVRELKTLVTRVDKFLTKCESVYHLAQEEESKKKRMLPVQSFKEYGLEKGNVLWTIRKGIRGRRESCTVWDVDKKKVKYKGGLYTLSGACEQIFGEDTKHGPEQWQFDGVPLPERRRMYMKSK